MKALVIAHDPDSLPSLVGDRLEHHGYELEVFMITDSAANPKVEVDFPSLDGFDLVVPMGAIWSLYDEETVGLWIHDELALLQEADRRQIPVLGICFGGQAVAAALGGSVVKSDTKQIGWYYIESTNEETLAKGPWFEWHYDRFNPPQGAEILAQDETCVQAFRLRRNLAVQFHPEVNHDHLKMWLEEEDGAGYVELSDNNVSASDLLRETLESEELALPNTNKLVDWFLTDVAVTGAIA